MYQFMTMLVQPYTILLLSLLAVLVCAWRSGRPRSKLVAAALGLLLLLSLLSLPPVAYVAVGTLEWSYPPSESVPAPGDTIVVLAGNMAVDDRQGVKIRVTGDTLTRCTHACLLYDRAGGCRIVVSGGKSRPEAPGGSVAEAMRDFLVLLGVSPADVVLEDKSTTTFENARNTCEILGADNSTRVFLVTSASHMWRAERCFARQGRSVVPAPCNYVAEHFELTPASFLPSLDALRMLHRAVHEWLGLVWYWMRGRI